MIACAMKVSSCLYERQFVNLTTYIFRLDTVGDATQDLNHLTTIDFFPVHSQTSCNCLLHV